MGGNMKDRWSVPVSAVANEFIDTYMAAANGEYVKVYLYVLRHQGEDITIELIADALNPVSYTHLDVYKRQMRSCFLCGWLIWILRFRNV